MRHSIIRYLLGMTLLLSWMCSSCSLETDGADGMEGYWHLVKVDTVETGGSRDLSEQLLFWSFQVNLLEMNDRNGNHQAVLLRFDKNESLLRVYEPHLHIPSDGDPLTDDLSYLTPFGMSDIEDTFTIEQKSGSKMILYNGILRLYFKRM